MWVSKQTYICSLVFLECSLQTIRRTQFLQRYSTEGDHEYVYSDDYYATLRLGYYIIDFTLANGSVTWSEAQY